ncbi:MAG: T9SS type A sorting domain-containing protein [Bacteroidetes bacterium]|jgi:hypothetical protein|nr:T9SS type A sorting domain-containing protein [Bacteroidota bacterium]
MKRKILLLLCFCMIMPFLVAGQGVDPLSGTLQNKSFDTKVKSVALYEKLTGGINRSSRMAKTADNLFLEKIESQFFDESDFRPFSTVEFDYEDGLLVEETSFIYDFLNPPGWIPESREVNTYENQVLTSTVAQIHTGQEFENSFRSLFTYQQAGGRMVPDEEISQNWNSTTGEFENTELSDFVVENDNLIRIDGYEWVDEEWSATERILIVEENGDLFLVLQEFFEGAWENDYRIIYSGQSFNELLDLLTESIETMENLGSSLLFFTLNPDFTEQAWTGTEWADDFRQISTVVTDGNTGEIVQKSILDQVFDGTNWFTETEIVAEYSNNQLSQITLSEADEFGNEQLQPLFKERFSYNDQDVLVQIIEEAFIAPMAKSKAASDETSVTGRVLLTWSDGIVTSVETDTNPFEYTLGNAYPNPFNPVTVVPFQAERAGTITIKVYDMLGRYVVTIADGMFPAGDHTAEFNASGLSSGVYLIRMQSEKNLQVQRVALVK